METTFTAGSHTINARCTCGECKPNDRDERSGNLDYGYRWDERAGSYVPRRCTVAAWRRELNKGRS